MINEKIGCPCLITTQTNLVFIGGLFFVEKPGFSGMNSLTTVYFSAKTGTSTFDGGSFHNLASLTTVILPASINRIGQLTFSGIGITTIEIHALFITRNSDNWTSQVIQPRLLL